MRQNFGAKGWLYPMPVLMIGTYNADGSANIMNAAWGGISEEREITICVDDSHKTAENLLQRGAFTVSIGTADMLVACDYVGITSGNQTPNKVARAGFHPVPSALVDAPYFEELPMALECKVLSYDTDTCRLVGKIVNVNADESVLTEGKIDVQKLRPITYDPVHHDYLVLGEAVGKAFCDGKKLK